jgi:hypothetical protein
LQTLFRLTEPFSQICEGAYGVTADQLHGSQSLLSAVFGGNFSREFLYKTLSLFVHGMLFIYLGLCLNQLQKIKRTSRFPNLQSIFIIF